MHVSPLMHRSCTQVISKVRNEKAKRFLANMREKQSISFSKHFHGADPKALALLRRMLAFDPQQRPSAVEALRDPYFQGPPPLFRLRCPYPCILPMQCISALWN
jgi:mitogen-activated protein kinase 1/3